MLELVEPGGRLAAALPELIEPGACIGNLRPEAAAALGLAPHTRVAGGGGDNMLAAIGTGNIRPGLLTASLGTSGTLSAYAERPLVSPHGELATFCASSGGWLPLACTMNLTAPAAWYRTCCTSTSTNSPGWPPRRRSAPRVC